jgi:hypothetical protein
MRRENWRKNTILFLEVSAKTGRNVEETFVSLTREIKNHRNSNVGEDDDPQTLKITSGTPANKCLC